MKDDDEYLSKINEIEFNYVMGYIIARISGEPLERFNNVFYRQLKRPVSMDTLIRRVIIAVGWSVFEEAVDSLKPLYKTVNLN